MAEVVHPAFPASGDVDDSVIRYPVTALLSEAVKLVTGTNREVEVEGMENDVTSGLVMSDTASGANVQ